MCLVAKSHTEGDDNEGDADCREGQESQHLLAYAVVVGHSCVALTIVEIVYGAIWCAAVLPMSGKMASFIPVILIRMFSDAYPRIQSLPLTSDT